MRWLHISDIHISKSDSLGPDKTYREDILDAMKTVLERRPVDCIIFTGDLFHQGKRNDELVGVALGFLKKVYKICSDRSDWGWNEGMKMTRLFYCPGNHDVLREAYVVDQVDEKWIVTHRKEVLGCSTTDGYFSAVDSDKKVLTEESFKLFEQTMGSIVAKECYASDFPHEFKKFQLPGNGKGLNASFFGINTALLAGQTYPENDVSKELTKAYQNFTQADSQFDTSRALEQYKKYHTAAQKKLGYLMNDAKNLCFISQEAEQQLATFLRHCRIPIFFGHHPLSFFSEHAKGQFESLVKSHKVSVYLCGHMHQAAGALIHDSQLPFWTSEQVNSIYQITVGGIFLDRSNYNQTSFAIGQVDVLEDGSKARLNVTVFVRSPNIFGVEDLVSYSPKEVIIAIKTNDETLPDEEPSTSGQGLKQPNRETVANPEIPDSDGKTGSKSSEGGRTEPRKKQSSEGTTDDRKRWEDLILDILG